jgi:hypothetical protein
VWKLFSSSLVEFLCRFELTSSDQLHLLPVRRSVALSSKSDEVAHFHFGGSAVAVSGFSHILPETISLHRTKETGGLSVKHERKMNYSLRRIVPLIGMNEFFSLFPPRTVQKNMLTGEKCLVENVL